MKDVERVDVVWRKSSRTGSQGNDCVEVARPHHMVAVRDSKDPDGPVLSFGPRAWREFVSGVKAQSI
ncbi:DUF397 domain-containing protein [Spirillospora sp. NBC_01491]|uniref:DUF397 domain-containing protein n=1 Tax=Spirillospora sp. NBC_01491 TaxID=2976007 RepID=UPI002E303AD6|nr:DUF397 domain-containing protein [Spirillospora sp. NBC_01491]